MRLNLECHCGTVYLSFILTLFLWSPTAGQQERFLTNSTWYTPIPDRPIVTSRSKDYVNDMVINSKLLGVVWRDWSVPVWKALPSTKFTKVTLVTEEGIGGRELEQIQAVHRYWRNNGWDLVPIPTNAKTSGHDSRKHRDRHMTVISADRRYAWDFWQATKDSASGMWRARIVRRWELSGKGFSSPYDHHGSCRVCPTSLLHGLIRYDELVERGAVKPNARIEHALAFSYWGQQKKRPDLPNFVHPCQKYNGGINTRPGAMLLGQRLQLNPELDLDDPRYGLSLAGKVVARALQEYGMIFVENAGPGYNGLYAEDMINKTNSWSGILSTSELYKIPLSEFRAIEFVKEK